VLHRGTVEDIIAGRRTKIMVKKREYGVSEID